jgi:hypothetical protein
MAADRNSVESILATKVRNEVAGDEMGCKLGYITRRELGRGEQGVAYSMNKNASGRNISRTHVLKISVLGSPKVRRLWENEAKLSKALGLAGIGPEIFDFWVCRGKGYILMQKMKSDLRHYIGADGKPISLKSKSGNSIDHLNQVPEPILRDYVDKLEKMIGADYVHFDNHPGNLGIIENDDGEEEGILFDFGFTRKVDGMTHPDKYNALAFSIGQILEHMPVHELDSNYLFKILVSIDKGTYVYGSLIHNVTDADIAAFRAYYKIPDASFGFDFTPHIASPDGLNRSLYVGAKLYNYFLNISDKDKAYNKWVPYGIIYDIRQNKKIPDALESATLPIPDYPAATEASVSNVRRSNRLAKTGTGASTLNIRRSNRLSKRGATAKAAAGAGTRGGQRRTRCLRRH